LGAGNGSPGVNQDRNPRRKAAPIIKWYNGHALSFAEILEGGLLLLLLVDLHELCLRSNLERPPVIRLSLDLLFVDDVDGERTVVLVAIALDLDDHAANGVLLAILPRPLAR